MFTIINHNITLQYISIDPGWRYESRRYPDMIKNMKAWGEGDEYPFIVQYSAFVLVIGVCMLVSALVAMARKKIFRGKTDIS